MDCDGIVVLQRSCRENEWDGGGRNRRLGERNVELSRSFAVRLRRSMKSAGREAEAVRNSLRNDPYAVMVPAFSQFLPDRVGRLWVREAHLADAPGSGALNTIPPFVSQWSVFDQTGRWLGDVTMPARFQPRDIGADYVLGTALDKDGVQSIALYRLGTSKVIR